MFSGTDSYSLGVKAVNRDLAYTVGDVEDTLVRDALRHANALELLGTSPEGWITRVGERGSRFHEVNGSASP
ncbi:hypothetical protein ACIPYV_16605 [Paenarthrobacter nicotinovorans]|uniref:hypothetical protein n=1 Tax=Paenarthrobacter nicotinovorans TaxID=29320 RepID=UPI00381FD530